MCCTRFFFLPSFHLIVLFLSKNFEDAKKQQQQQNISHHNSLIRSFCYCFVRSSFIPVSSSPSPFLLSFSFAPFGSTVFVCAFRFSLLLLTCTFRGGVSVCAYLYSFCGLSSFQHSQQHTAYILYRLFWSFGSFVQIRRRRRRVFSVSFTFIFHFLTQYVRNMWLNVRLYVCDWERERESEAHACTRTFVRIHTDTYT